MDRHVVYTSINYLFHSQLMTKLHQRRLSIRSMIRRHSASWHWTSHLLQHLLLQDLRWSLWHQRRADQDWRHSFCARNCLLDDSLQPAIGHRWIRWFGPWFYWCQVFVAVFQHYHLNTHLYVSTKTVWQIYERWASQCDDHMNSLPSIYFILT